MAKDFVITDEMRSIIGKTLSTWTYEVSRQGVRGMARGVGYKDMVYYDVEAAKKAGYRDLPLPPGYWGYPVFIPGQSHDIVSFQPKELEDVIGHGLVNILDGSIEVEYFKQICAGDTLTGEIAIVALDTKESPQFGTMLFLSQELILKNEQGEVAAKKRTTAIFY